MPDDGPRHDEEATARAEADVMGLGVLDAVDVGGTWTVVGEGDGPEPEAPLRERPEQPEQPDERRRRRRPFWLGGAAAAALALLVAAAISQLPGPGPARVPTPPRQPAGAGRISPESPRPRGRSRRSPPAARPAR